MKFYERVISDFGGYEKCKDILSLPNIDFIMNAQGLREHMLEYRREHNIFEVGDKVVWINSIAPNDPRIFEVEASLGEKPDTWSLRHATDEEIKAGKRLEVNS
ncbi:hypothetical protein [Acinetobacter indicus]|uniref:Uncharacterized protein n=1 Tax=Acinetobacter indicus TaxID=756892 RepID=A0A6C0Y4K0_9GAMM|nr:hypothetical protein [Acinetobacter indicus]QIC70792.1 hypothetical protein FSC09_10395 [Acinetobacter indicus]